MGISRNSITWKILVSASEIYRPNFNFTVCKLTPLKFIIFITSEITDYEFFENIWLLSKLKMLWFISYDTLSILIILSLFCVLSNILDEISVIFSCTNYLIYNTFSKLMLMCDMYAFSRKIEITP